MAMPMGEPRSRPLDRIGVDFDADTEIGAALPNQAGEALNSRFGSQPPSFTTM